MSYPVQHKSEACRYWVLVYGICNLAEISIRLCVHKAPFLIWSRSQGKMFITNSIPALALCFGVVGTLLHIIWRSFKDYQGRKAHGCGPIPAYPQWDRVFGLDLALSQLRALRGDYFIPWLAAMHEGRPSTFTIRFLGKRQIFTTETENLKSMTAINWEDFGISPLRRHTRAFHPFADKGVNTVDGEDWVFSRFLIKPFFNRNVYTSTDRIRPYVDSFLSLVPPDGETFNVQPLLQRWVSLRSKRTDISKLILI